MKIVTADITGSLIVNGVDVTSNVVSSSVFSGSIAGRVTSLEQFSASLDATFATDASVTASILVLSQSVQTSQAALSSSYTATSGSYVAVSGSYVITSGSYAAASASLSTRVTNTEATASTNTQASASFAAYSGSMSTRLTTDETNITTLTNASSSFAAQSASLSTRLTTDETNFTNLSSSFATTSGSLSGRVTIIEGQDATTGSNIFTGTQRITDTSNAISFTSTASLYTDGGLRVSKDSFVSGTAYFNNVVVYGTSSIQYITSSQVNFGTNIITVNTDTPAVRFGGLAVFDSGSTQLTGSMLWDSEKNHWIYSNPSGSTYNSAMLMNGPRNTGSLGNEQGTTSCYLMAGQGGDHITSSQIYHDSTITCIPNTLVGCVGCFSSTITATGTIRSNDVNSYQLFQASNTTDTKLWSIQNLPTSGDFRIRAGNDAFTNGINGITISRTGISSVNVALGGNTTIENSGTFTIGSTAGTGTGTLYASTACFASRVCTNGLTTVDQLTATTTNGGTSAIFLNSGVQNSNGIEIRGGTSATAVNWKLEKDNTVGNAFQITPSTTNGGTTFTTPAFTLTSAGAATFISTITGTTIYGSTAVCSPVGKFTTCIDAGSGIFSSCVGTTALNMNNMASLGSISGGSIYLPYTAGLFFRSADGSTAKGKIQADNSNNLLLNSDNGGCVGIGLTNPTYKLEVCGGSSQVSSFVKHINGDGVNTSFVNLCSNGYSSYIYIGSSPGLDWKLGKNVLNTGTCTYFQIVDSSNNLRLQINADGNVGIGTASPAYKLDVNGNVGANFYAGKCMTLSSWSSNNGLILNYGSASGQVAAINLQANSITNGYIGMQMVDSSNGDLWLGGSSGKSMTLYRTGNTGFRTDTPCTGVHVEGGYGATWGGNGCFFGGGVSGGGFPYGDIYGNGAAYTYQTCCTTATSSVLLGGYAAGYFKGGPGTYYGGGGAGIVAIGGNGANSEGVNSGGGAGIFARGGLNGAATALSYAGWFDGGNVIVRCGNVGIGTTTPNSASPLHIKMCSDSNGDGIRIQATCSGASGSQPGIAFANVSDAKRWSISLDNTSDIIQITNAAGASALIINQSNISCFAGTVCAPCFATISDYRMKSNIRPIEGLSIIMNTKPYKFEYNYDCSTSFGMIAHELQDTLPEAVFGQKDGEVMQGVDYMKLLPITIKAIQEQQCTICSQTSMINILKTCLGIA